MWTGKSAAKTFFSRLFEKKKKKEDSHDIRPARWVQSRVFCIFFSRKILYVSLPLAKFIFAKFHEKVCEIRKKMSRNFAFFCESYYFAENPNTVTESFQI